MKSIWGPLFVCFLAIPLSAQPPVESVVSLQAPAGAPLRLYLTKKVNKKIGAPVEAKVMEPVYAFDRIVIPAGAVAEGEVTRTQPVSKWQRIQAILNGDFTPLHRAQVSFTSLRLPDGRELPAHTIETYGLDSIYIEPSAKQKKKAAAAAPQAQNNGIMGTAKQTAKDRLNAEINTRSRGLADIVRGPNKKEKFVDFLWSKAPYHPQYWRRGTRFDAPLGETLNLGSATVDPAHFTQLGAQPQPDAVAQIRMLTAVSSATAKVGDPIKAILTAPVFSPSNQLLLPAGTQLEGQVVVAHRARLFHRPGQLRFTFQKINLPEDVAALRLAPPDRMTLGTQAILQAAEGSGKAPIKVDGEGGVQAKESNTRFIAPVISVMLASRAADNDAGKNHPANAPGDNNIGGRTLGGGLGFGLAGTALAQSSRYVGMAFGYYGLAWSVYRSVIDRGGEVEFDKNAMMQIKFGARVPGNKFVADDDNKDDQ